MRDVKVLIIDDDEIDRISISKSLKSEDVNCIFAKNGKEALGFLESDHFDFAVLDYMLPDIDSKEILKKYSFKLPFIIVTGYGDELVAVDMMKLGAVDYVPKNKLDLLSNIAEILIEKSMSLKESLKEIHNLNLKIKEMVNRYDNKDQ